MDIASGCRDYKIAIHSNYPSELWYTRRFSLLIEFRKSCCSCKKRALIEQKNVENLFHHFYHESFHEWAG